MLLPLLLLAHLACAPSEPAPIVNPAVRREQLREELKARLGPAYTERPAALDQADPVAGRAVYGKSCMSCHGSTGGGDGPRAYKIKPRPATLVGPSSGFFSEAAELELIAEGSPGTGMPAWKRALKPQQMADAYAYILSMRAQDSAR